MLQDLRRPVVAGDQDIGKRLVVAQQHVEARPQLLDQIGFEQQRLGLGGGGDDLDRDRRGDHARIRASTWPARPGIGGQPLLDVLGLADIEHVACRRSACGRRRARSAPSRTACSIAARPTASRRRPARRPPRPLPAAGLVVLVDRQTWRVDVLAPLPGRQRRAGGFGTAGACAVPRLSRGSSIIGLNLSARGGAASAADRRGGDRNVG